MANLNNNFPRLRKQTKLSMKAIGEEIGKFLNNNPISTSTIQTYETSSTPSLDVIHAMVKFFQTYDENFTTDHLCFKDLEEENYELPLDKVNQKFSEITIDQESTDQVILIKMELYEDLIKKSLLLTDKLLAENEDLKSKL